MLRITSALALLMFAPLALAQDPINAIEFRTNGSGCPKKVWGDLPVNAEDGWLTLSFAQEGLMSAQSSEGQSLEESRRQCSLTFHLAPEAGYRYALTEVKAVGQLDLHPGDQLSLQIDSFFAGTSRFTRLETREFGEDAAGFSYYGKLEAKDRVYSACGAEALMSINSVLRFQNQAQQRQAQAASAKLEQISYRVEKLPCPSN